MKDGITKNLEEALDIKPVEDNTPTLKLPALNVDVKTMDYTDFSSELQVLYALANRGMEIQEMAMEEISGCDSQRDKSELISSATSALSASISAIDKATKLKLKILQDYENPDKKVDDGTITISREEVLEIISKRKK